MPYLCYRVGESGPIRIAPWTLVIAIGAEIK